MNDRSVSVPFTVADPMGVAIETDDGLDGVSAGLQFIKTAGKPIGAWSRSATGWFGSQFSTSTAKKGSGRNQFGPFRGSRPDSSRDEEHVDPARQAPGWHRRSAVDLEASGDRAASGPSSVAARAGLAASPVSPKARMAAQSRTADRDPPPRHPLGVEADRSDLGAVPCWVFRSRRATRVQQCVPSSPLANGACAPVPPLAKGMRVLSFSPCERRARPRSPACEGNARFPFPPLAKGGPGGVRGRPPRTS